MNTITSKIDAVLKTIREDARANEIPADLILRIYAEGRFEHQVRNEVPNAAFVLYHAHPDAPEHNDKEATATTDGGRPVEQGAASLEDEVRAVKDELAHLRQGLAALAHHTGTICALMQSAAEVSRALAQPMFVAEKDMK